MVSRRPLGAALAVITMALTAAGCVSMPSGGPVVSYTVTQGAGGQPQNYPQIFPQPPGTGWDPQEIVQGFLTASAAFGDRQQLAKQYLTPDASKLWRPASGGTIVYSNGPYVGSPQVTKKDSHGKPVQKTVLITGTVQKNLTSQGSYAVPSASAPDSPQVFTLVKVSGQWRISSAPSQLLLTSVLFQDDYQLRNLYFFDPNGRVLVPHPVYVPLRATPAALLNGLVADLIKPPDDWLSRGGATKTAFPKGTKPLGDVTLDGGTATVNLGGTITKASTEVMRQVSAQLLRTLTGAGQGGPAVKSIQVNVNGKPWPPPGAQENPVQRQSNYRPPTGASETFYYVDRAGYLTRRDGISAKPVHLGKIGPGVTQLAVSPVGQSLAVVRGGALLTGSIGGKLVRQAGSGYQAISWDPEGNLWATENGQVVMLPRGGAAAGQPRRQPLPVTVYDPDGTRAGPFTALRIAPDGVRVALVVGGTTLKFGAISGQPGSTSAKQGIKVELSPFYVSGTAMFVAVTWYGPDNVITLGDQGPQQEPVITEYPVSGGNSTSIQGESTMTTLTASAGNALVVGLSHGGLATDGGMTGAWAQLSDGTAPAYGTTPAYPG